MFDGALNLKALGNELCTKVGGRSIHPITAVVGGFTHEIGSDEYRELADKMDAALPFALAAVDLFASFPVPDIESTSLYQPHFSAARIASFIVVLPTIFFARSSILLLRISLSVAIPTSIVLLIILSFLRGSSPLRRIALIICRFHVLRKPPALDQNKLL